MLTQTQLSHTHPISVCPAALPLALPLAYVRDAAGQTRPLRASPHQAPELHPGQSPRHRTGHEHTPSQPCQRLHTPDVILGLMVRQD